MLRGSTGQLRLEDAREWERKERVRLARQDGDLSVRAGETPFIQDWAETFFDYKAQKLKRPDLLEREIRVVLEFCGRRPPSHRAPSKRKNPPPRRVVPVAPPYHDLRLGDFIEHPERITEFEEWMVARRVGGSARNHYRSVLSGMYKVAMLPQYRRATGIRTNPFASIERDRPTRRRVIQSVEDLRAWIEHAGPHVQLALAIGALMPALRKQTILSLRWDVNIDRDLRFITVHDHKGDTANPEPITQPISDQLRVILESARPTTAQRTTKPTSTHVIQFRGRAVKSINRGLRNAAARASIKYGVAAGGATFHTLRHTMATMLAELGVPESHRKNALAHADVQTTQIYTHLRPMHLVGPLEQLSAAVQLSDVMSKPAVGKVAGRPAATAARSEGSPATTAKRPKGPNQRKTLGNKAKTAVRRRAS